MKKLSFVFAALAFVLSNAMCATVAYNYAIFYWGGQNAAYGAPAWIAFLFIIPYAIGIAICVVLSFYFNKRHGSSK